MKIAKFCRRSHDISHILCLYTKIKSIYCAFFWINFIKRIDKSYDICYNEHGKERSLSDIFEFFFFFLLLGRSAAVAEGALRPFFIF